MRFLGLTLSLLWLCVSTAWAITSYLNANDQARLKNILQSGLQSDDLGVLDHSLRGLAVFGSDIKNSAAICAKINAKIGTSPSIETLFHVGKASAVLKCQLQLPANAQEKLESAISSSSSVSELFFATGALSSLGYGLEAPKVLKALNAALKKEDGIVSLGQSFHIAALLDGDVSSIFDRIEDAIVQADQVDGKMLQFEGGLSVTALVISGAYQLAQVAGKAPPITKDQANKFAEYFVSRKSVQTVKGAHCLLEVASVLASNPFHIPVAVTLSGKTSVSQKDPTFQVKVTNILGNGLGPLNVVADSATSILDDAVILSQKQLTPVDEQVEIMNSNYNFRTTFELDLMSTKPGKGIYRVALTTTASSPDSHLVGNTGAVVEIKVLSRIDIEDAEIGTADSDQSTAAKLKRVAFPSKYNEMIEADWHQKLILKFLVRDVNSKELITVHQAFVRLTHAESQQEIFFVAEPDVNDVYKFDLDLASKAKEFHHLSGKYSMHLIIGDAVIENPTVWAVADLQLTFGAAAAAQPSQPSPTVQMYQARPEIKHLFREPEKRPPAVVSNLFTLLVLLPFFIFIILAAKLGINPTSVSLSPVNLVFHLSFGAILGLFLCFWFYMNMFQTLKWLLILAPFAFLTGNYMLRQVAKQRSSRTGVSQ
nr:EOG090X04WQ [Sida crystallina]